MLQVFRQPASPFNQQMRQESRQLKAPWVSASQTKTSHAVNYQPTSSLPSLCVLSQLEVCTTTAQDGEGFCVFVSSLRSYCLKSKCKLRVLSWSSSQTMCFQGIPSCWTSWRQIWLAGINRKPNHSNLYWVFLLSAPEEPSSLSLYGARLDPFVGSCRRESDGLMCQQTAWDKKKWNNQNFTEIVWRTSSM